MDTQVTALSISDQNFILAGFQEGSIGVFHGDYSSPLSIWYNTCPCAVKAIKWCSIYFSDGKKKAKQESPVKGKHEAHVFEESRFATRICEFFVLDERLVFYIWNLNKDIHNPVHKIDFGEKHSVPASLNLPAT